MRNKVLFCLAGFIAFFAGVTWWCWLPSSDNISIPLSQKPATDIKAVAIANDAFQKLPGWHKNHFLKSLQAFQESCKVFLNIDPQQETGNNHIPLKAKDWHPACIAAKSLSLLSNETAKAFFERWFVPIELSHHRKEGLFTGYYLPTVQGSLIKTKQFTVPIYALPKKHYQQ
jgi:membrane-bound lytic murein transglycosylase A